MHVEHHVDALRACPAHDLGDAGEVGLADLSGRRLEQAPRDVQPDHVEAQRMHLWEVEVAHHHPLDLRVVRRARAVGVRGRIDRVGRTQIGSEVVDQAVHVDPLEQHLAPSAVDDLGQPAGPAGCAHAQEVERTRRLRRRPRERDPGARRAQRQAQAHE